VPRQSVLSASMAAANALPTAFTQAAPRNPPNSRLIWGAKRMPKMVKKANLPQKICAACRLPFTWRKKWARDWDSVKYCSDRCRAGK
jgi:hypothetical protein